MGYLLCGCHAIQLLLSVDFMYHYAMWGACTKGNTEGGMVPGTEEGFAIFG